MSMKAYAIRIVLGCMVLVGMAMYGLAYAGGVTPPAKPTGYTLVIITETYHGTSSATVPGYPTRATCVKAQAAVRGAGERMQYEKETDYLYTDTYCIPTFGASHDH